MQRRSPLLSLAVLLVVQCGFVFGGEAVDPGAKLVAALGPLIDVINGKVEQYSIRAEFDYEGKKGVVEADRFSARDYAVHIKVGADIEGTLTVSENETRLDIAPKNSVFVGSGALAAGDELIDPAQLVTQAAKLSNGVQVGLAALQQGDREGLGVALDLMAKIDITDAGNGVQTFKVNLDKKGAPVQFNASRDKEHNNAWVGEFHLTGGTKDAPVDNVIKFTIAPKAERHANAQGRTEIAVKRAELERSLQRGGMRALDIQNDTAHARAPQDGVVNIPGARLEVAHGQRVCYLTGTPAEMGHAHGRLLKREIRRVTDSTLYVVGMYYSVGKGKWFLDEIRDAWKHLEPNIDKDYLTELDAIAEAAGIDKEELRLANIFPELFHCSGFAIANEATVGGKLFHGRVLDYMTEIGLQHAQVDFITRGANRSATVNVGYAGFIGCVTGMNDAQISMGEMGGNGVGKWDGTPMAFLMRRVLEHAETLEQAREILEKAKRTCEYYYVIADGKTRSAYAVGAWPEKIEFLKQGEAHEKLPTALKGCVLLSAGKRYEDLSQRAKDGFGKIDEAAAIQLMARPVAMASNLHSVLFVPEDQVYHAAHASLRGHKAASEMKYVKHDFKAQVKVLDELDAAKAKKEDAKDK